MCECTCDGTNINCYTVVQWMQLVKLCKSFEESLLVSDICLHARLLLVSLCHAGDCGNSDYMIDYKKYGILQ